MHGLLHAVLALPKITKPVVPVGLENGCRKKKIRPRLGESETSSLRPEISRFVGRVF